MDFHFFLQVYTCVHLSHHKASLCPILYLTLIDETEGNSMLCGPETVDVFRGKVFYYMSNKSQRNEKIKRTSYENT